MRTTTLTLALILTSFAWIDEAPAGNHGGSGFSFGSKNWSVSVNQDHKNKKHHNNYYNKQYKHVIVEKVYVYPQCYHPFHSTCFVQPGDSFHSIALREYGNGNMWRNVATFNGLSSQSPLVIGQQVALPVINRDGSLTASPAPPATLIGSAPTAQVSVETETSLPTIPMGSVLNLEGQDFGAEAGTVRLRISGLILPVEVISWQGSAAKVRMPSLELAEAVDGEIEVLRADGTLASKSAVRLVPATDRLAMGN
jgi:hypothetical protein